MIEDRATRVVHAGRPPRIPDTPLNYPVVAASTYVSGGDLEYGRYGNPTWTAFETALGTLEGGRALAFASGTAATNAILASLSSEAVVVAPNDAYSGTLSLLAVRPNTRLVDIADTDAVREAMRGATMLWLESPTNPGLSIADVPELCVIGRQTDVVVVVDNTFATPLLQRPLESGADVVLHSATKYLSGHGDVVLGAIVTNDSERYDQLAAHRTNAGAIPGPFETWLALRGLRTLHLRVDRAGANAMTLANRLAAHPRVERVRFPGLPSHAGHERAKATMDGYGAIICIEVDGGAAAADRVVSRTELWTPATSLGGLESTLERRRRWPAESALIPDNLLRLSVGIEAVDDLWSDLDQALRL